MEEKKKKSKHYLSVAFLQLVKVLHVQNEAVKQIFMWVLLLSYTHKDYLEELVVLQNQYFENWHSIFFEEF